MVSKEGELGRDGRWGALRPLGCWVLLMWGERTSRLAYGVLGEFFLGGWMGDVPVF